MSRPLLLDLFCGAGGAAVGYHRAGFDVVGVDIRPQPRYPFPMIVADALDVLNAGPPHEPWMSYGPIDAIHASPPCQAYSRAMRHLASGYPRLIEVIRDRLIATSAAWVIENVQGAPLPHQSDLFGWHGVELCGSMFGLRVQRHRLFQISMPVVAPRGCDHSMLTINPYNANTRRVWFEREGWRAEMGVNWMGAEGSESFPPAYTEYIGRQLMAALAFP